ncbi:unnamed protein product [Caenorhabditis sp. 36 PRJEB53466]|nr:unnamed protein product [Caenorhabditis sp. 36 PRJEB53466]
MASSSTAYHLKDAGFHIRNVPKEWNDWNLFHVFQKFGRVGYCRVAATSQDASFQLGFVNMLAVSDADEVRKNLHDGTLAGQSFSLRVSDLKTNAMQPVLTPTHKLLSSPPPKNVPTLLPSAWLPLNKDIEVEVVDYLPSSSVADDLFAVTVIQINDPIIEEKYALLHEKLNAYAQLSPFDSELEIGYDGVYRENARSLHRVRRISANKLYLVDAGKVVAYDKSKVFQLPKVFSSTPTKVSLCGIDGLKWFPAAIPSFDKIRDVVKQWGRMENSVLHAIACGFQGSINMISLNCGNSILAERLNRKGACLYVPRNMQPRYAYSRDLLLERNNQSTTATISNDADVVSDLLKKIEGVKSMLRDLELSP